MTTTFRLMALMVTTLGVSLAAQRGGGPPAGPPNPLEGQPQAIEDGRQIYNKACTVCHGLDGAPGEMAPALGLEGRRFATRNASEIFGAIKDGIPATGMPPSPDLSDQDTWKITAYIQALRGTAIDAPTVGNAAAGEGIFWGKGACGQCHMVGGKGGVIGPELSAIADLRKTASIVDALTNPQYRVQGDGGAIPRKLEPPNDYAVVRVTLPDGKVLRGVVKNENSISMQILGVEDSRLHLLDRRTLRAVQYETTSLMPRDYKTRLTEQELQDLMAFLTRLSRRQATNAFAHDYFVYAGTYTNPSAKTTSASKGIYAWRFDSSSGALTPIGLVAETVNPAHVWASPDGRFLYAVNWSTADPAGDTVSSFTIDRKTGALKLLNKVSSHGESPNQVVLDPSGRIAATVTYNGGTITAFGVEPNGRLTEAIYTEKHAGQPLSAKQPGPRAHGIVFSKDGRWAYVAQLGLDRVYTYRVDPAKRTFAPADPPFVTMNAGGSGPRRLQLHPTGTFLYVNHETDSKVSVFAVDGAKLSQIQTLSTLPADYKGNNSTAEIQIDQTGTWLYVTNRGHDSMAHYAVDPVKGTLTLIGHIPSGGRTPRNITIDPTNRHLIAANQNGDNIVVFRIDPKTGHLTPTGSTGQVAQPGGVYFVTAE